MVDPDNWYQSMTETSMVTMFPLLARSFVSVADRKLNKERTGRSYSGKFALCSYASKHQDPPDSSSMFDSFCAAARRWWGPPELRARPEERRSGDPRSADHAEEGEEAGRLKIDRSRD
jgi:hypothetical protein